MGKSSVNEGVMGNSSKPCIVLLDIFPAKHDVAGGYLISADMISCLVDVGLMDYFDAFFCITSLNHVQSFSVHVCMAGEKPSNDWVPNFHTTVVWLLRSSTGLKGKSEQETVGSFVVKCGGFL